MIEMDSVRLFASVQQTVSTSYSDSSLLVGGKADVQYLTPALFLEKGRMYGPFGRSYAAA